MKLSDLRKGGSQQLDDMAEFILTDRSLLIYEQSGNGLYFLKRAYKIIGSKFNPVVDVELPYIERLFKPSRLELT